MYFKLNDELHVQTAATSEKLEHRSNIGQGVTLYHHSL